jgi:hypothetical protein
MRWFLPFAALALTIPGSAMAQDASGSAIAEQQAAMKRFAWMQGVWRGPAKGVNRSGPYTVTQTERIGPFLSGTVIVMEGKGYSPDGGVGFNAFGILSYDAAAKGYKLHSYALGYAGDFTLTPTANGYVWVTGSQPPRRIFEMTLKRVGDTDWPEGGGVPRD